MEFTAGSKPHETAFQYVPLEGAEKLERYCPGGFHTVSINDVLHDKYPIVHKLGFGGYSTTWLARDQTANRYVAVKTAIAASNSAESDILRRLGATNAADGTHPGKALMTPVLDEFTVSSPNGQHRCFVTTPARMSLSTAKMRPISG
jgi:serine/threonine protein kinase